MGMRTNKVHFALLNPTQLTMALMAVGYIHSTYAAELKLGDDWSGNFDTTLSYGASWRASKPTPSLIGVGNGGTAGTVNSDDGDLNFKRGHLISNAVRATHELELSREGFGLFGRVTYGYDEVASRDSVDALGGSKDKIGHDARLLDLYGRYNGEIGGRPFAVRVGQQVVNWGESLFIQNGLSVINPFDLSTLHSPGTELREAYIPTPLLWASQQLTPDASVEGFLLLRADHHRLEPRGTYFSSNDVLTGRLGRGDASDRLYMNGMVPDQSGLDPTALPAFAGGTGQFWVDRTTTRKAQASDQFGLSFHQSFPEWNQLDMGFYAMQYTSRVPFLSFNAAGIGQAPSSAMLGAGGASYFVEYPSRIQLYGLSARAQGPFGLSLQGEYSYRPNQPVQRSVSDLSVIAATAGLLGSPVAGTEIQGYDRTNMHQVQIGATKTFSSILGANTTALAAEVGYTHLGLRKDSYYDAPATYMLSPALATAFGTAAQTTGFQTRDSWGYVVYYQLEYSDLIAGSTLAPRIAFSHDVHGTGPTFTQGVRSVSIGSSLTSSDKSWKLDLSYTSYSGGRTYVITDPTTGYTYSSSANLLKDRDFISASASYAF
jgi:hypothetical protein